MPGPFFPRLCTFFERMPGDYRGLGRPQLGLRSQVVKAQFLLRLAFDRLFQHQPSVGIITNR